MFFIERTKLVEYESEDIRRHWFQYYFSEIFPSSYLLCIHYIVKQEDDDALLPTVSV